MSHHIWRAFLEPCQLTERAPQRRSTFSAVSLKVVFGIDTRDSGDEIIRIVEDVLEWIGDGLAPGKYLVDVFPILRHIPPWVPGATVQRLAARWRSTVVRLKNEPYRRVTAAMVGATPHCEPGVADKLFLGSRGSDSGHG